MKIRTLIGLFFAALLSVASCVRQEPEDARPQVVESAPAPKVPISFDIALPSNGLSTKTMAHKPDIKNVVVAVFGDAGYFNEWVPAEAATVMATENGVQYKLSVKLTMSASRLRLHIIANCPAEFYSNPPITGISTQDTEEIVMSKVLSHLGDQYTDGSGSGAVSSNIEDGYWQKIYLPYGIEAEVEENGNGDIVYKTDENGIVATDLTKNQFIWLSPIPLVRNFARLKLQVSPTVAEAWEITHVGLVNAPKKGVIAPILSTPYKVDIWGARLNVTETYIPPDATHPDGQEVAVAYPVQNDNTVTSGIGLHLQGHELVNNDGTDKLLATQVSTMYDELFVTNYQNLPLETTEKWRLLTDAPYNYGGTAPVPLEFADNPKRDSDLVSVPLTQGAPDYDKLDFMYVYERPKPRVLSGKAESPTRILIKARQKNVTDAQWKYFPLDIVDNAGNPIAILRNHTYYISLTGIDKDAGDTDIEKAASSSGSNVSDSPLTQDLNEVSDGISSLAVEYIDKTITESGQYTLMFRYFPVLTTHQQNNDAVDFVTGYAGTTLGFQPGTVSGNGAVFKETNGNPTVSIEKTNGKANLYVRSGNGWALASSDEEKKTAWSKITFTTVDGNTGTNNKLFDYETDQTIRVEATNPDNHKRLHRDVLINLTKIKDLKVECAQKYVDRGLSKPEDFIIYLPNKLTRSMFPLELKIEAESGSITPRDGDNLPAESGSSIVPSKNGQSSFYFIRTVSKQEYNAIEPVIDDDGNYWRPVTCKFKTAKTESATAIYVSNPYFNLAHDSFLNYDKRLFTDLAFSNLRQEGDAAYVTFTYQTDKAHNGGTVVWDNHNGGELPSDYKVVPRWVSFEFTNLSPKKANGDLLQNGFFSKGNSNTYFLYELEADGTPSNAAQNPTLSFRVVDPSQSFGVKIHTKDLPADDNQPAFVPNPILFDEASQNYSVTAVTGISMAQQLSLSRGAEQTLAVSFTPSNATFKYVKWSSSDTSVATVDANGKVTAVGLGTAIITAEALPVGSGIKATCVVTVADVALTSVSLPATLSLNVGNSQTLTPTLNPTNASVQSTTWTTSNGSIANVSQDGTVTGVASGTANITVTVTDYSGNTRSATCAVTVVNSITVEINLTSVNSVTQDGVTLSFTNYTWYNTTYGAYSNNSNSTLTISVGSGYSLKSVDIEMTYNANYSNWTANTGSVSSSGSIASWISSNQSTQSVRLTPGSQYIYFNRITITYE